MMMAEVAGQKRRNEEGLDFLSRESGDGVCRISKRFRTGGDGCGGGGGRPVTIKEKKDKIGERVAELQKLVSPFGKTDTASVLQEATGYIKFLHEQLQVLSGPYLRSTPTGTLQEAEHYSLRNRGLCLMPMAITLKIARSNGADIWAPINTSSPKF